MSCDRHAEALVDFARGEWLDAAAGAALDAHVATCERCAARLEREWHLTAGMRAVVAQAADARPPEGLQQALLAAFEQFRLERPRPGEGGPAVRPAPVPSWRGWAAIAAMLAVTIAGATLAWQAAEPAAGRRGVGAPPGPPNGEVAGSEFVPWPGAAALPAFESGQLVRTELPASVLPLLGLTPSHPVSGAMVLADILVGQDGMARAVRLAP